MNNNRRIYELTQPYPKQLEIKSYVIKYSNCDYIYTEDIRNRTRRIFERKKLDKFKEVNHYDYLENELVFGFSMSEELINSQLKKISILYEIQLLENKVENLNATKSYYNSKIKDLKSEVATIDFATSIKYIAHEPDTVPFTNRYER